MKKYLSMVLIMALCAISLTACGESSTSDVASDVAVENSAQENDIQNETDQTDNTTQDSSADDYVQETDLFSDRTMPDGLVEIYVSAGNAADFVFHADKSSVDDFKTISYRFGDFDIKLSDFGEGYQCSTWTIGDGQAEFAEEENYIIDGSNYVIKAYLTSIVPCFDTMDGTYELYYESRDGKTYYYDLVWKDIVKQGKYEEFSQTDVSNTGTDNDNSSQQNVADLWIIDKQLHGDASKLTEGEYVYIKFHSPDSNGLPTMVSMNYHLRVYAYGQTEPEYRDVNGDFAIKNVRYTEEIHLVYCELTQGTNGFEGDLYTDSNELVSTAIRQVGDY